jgi:hypothetical protein
MGRKIRRQIEFDEAFLEFLREDLPGVTLNGLTNALYTEFRHYYTGEYKIQLHSAAREIVEKLKVGNSNSNEPLL